VFFDLLDVEWCSLDVQLANRFCWKWHKGECERSFNVTALCNWVSSMKGMVYRIFFILSFNLLIGWQLSICNCYKPLFSLLYNCKLLCFWWLALSIAPTAFFLDFATSRMFTTNSLYQIMCSINNWHLFFKEDYF
jgi:hypothetical protein